MSALLEPMPLGYQPVTPKSLKVYRLLERLLIARRSYIINFIDCLLTADFCQSTYRWCSTVIRNRSDLNNQKLANIKRVTKSIFEIVAYSWGHKFGTALQKITISNLHQMIPHLVSRLVPITFWMFWCPRKWDNVLKILFIKKARRP